MNKISCRSFQRLINCAYEEKFNHNDYNSFYKMKDKHYYNYYYIKINKIGIDNFFKHYCNKKINYHEKPIHELPFNFTPYYIKGRYDYDDQEVSEYLDGYEDLTDINEWVEKYNFEKYCFHRELRCGY